jgi:hypothetical protein
MSDFTVTELLRPLEPVTRDTFVADIALAPRVPAPSSSDASPAPATRRIYD